MAKPLTEADDSFHSPGAWVMESGILNEALTRLRWGERESLGLSEFLVQETADHA